MALIDHLGSRNYDAFIRNCTQFQIHLPELHVLVSHSFVLNVLQSRFRQKMLDSARAVFGSEVSLRFSLDNSRGEKSCIESHQSRAMDFPGTSVGTNSRFRIHHSADIVEGPATSHDALASLEIGNSSCTGDGITEPQVIVSSDHGLQLDGSGEPLLSIATRIEHGPTRSRGLHQKLADSVRASNEQVESHLVGNRGRSTNPEVLAKQAESTSIVGSIPESGNSSITPNPVQASVHRSTSPTPKNSAGGQRANSEGRRFSLLSEFVDGPGSHAALAAARQFASDSQGESGPLYLFGPTGVGKSHLMEGIAASLKRQDASRQVLLFTAEQFTNLFTGALRGHTLPSFRLKFRGVDVLLIDDVDFLDGKPKVQEEFLHTLQQLESRGKRFVLAADRHPRLLSRTRPELQTRYLSGTTCRLEVPDLTTREKIVAHKGLMLGMMLPPDAIRVIAKGVQASVRELEGALHNLRNLSRITGHNHSGQTISTAMAKQVVSELQRDCVRVVRLPDIERVVCETFGVSVEDLRSARRARAVSEPRMLAMYLARRHTRAAYAEIGAYFGGRNHATVMSAEKKIQAALDEGAKMVVAIQKWGMSELIDALEQQLMAS